MTIQTEQQLMLLHRGCTISTFYRLSTKATFKSPARAPQGYLRVSPKGEKKICFKLNRIPID